MKGRATASMPGPMLMWFDQNGNLLEQGYSNWQNNPYGYKTEEAKDFDDSMEVLRIQGVSSEEHSRSSTVRD